MTFELSEKYREHIEELERLACCGDEMAAKSLGCIALVCEGWRYGDPDPEDPDGGGGEGLPESNVVDFKSYLQRRAA